MIDQQTVHRKISAIRRSLQELELMLGEVPKPKKNPTIYDQLKANADTGTVKRIEFPKRKKAV